MNNIQKLSVVAAAGCLLASLIVSYYTNGYIVQKGSYNKQRTTMELKKEYSIERFVDELNSRGYDGAAADQENIIYNYKELIYNKVNDEAINPGGEKVYFTKAHMPTIIPLSLLLLCGLTFYLYKDD